MLKGICTTVAAPLLSVVTGTVQDASTGEAVIGAAVILQNTTYGAVADADGRFVINNVKPGTYTIEVQMLDSDGPVLLLPDIDSDYLELQLYTREPYMAAADTIWVDDDFVEIGETTEEVEEVPEDTLEEKNPSDAENQVETQIIGGADAPTEVRLQDDTDQKENTDAADKTDEDYGTEESAYYDGATGEITAESDWTPVGEKIRIQIK